MSDNSISSSKGQMPSEEFQDDRVLKDISRIPINPISRDKLFGTPENGMRTDLDELKRHLVLEGRLEKADLIELVRKARAEFDKEPNLLRLRDPVAVCGDIHGQFYDMAKLFEVAGDPANFQFLFLGDYVDRGCFSTEVVIYLFAVKINYPKTLFLLRGNHECRHLTSFFNFKDECKHFYAHVHAIHYHS